MELAGDVPKPVGPHRAALSLVSDGETMGQLWACPLHSVSGTLPFPSVVGPLCGALAPSSGGGDFKPSVYVDAPVLT